MGKNHRIHRSRTAQLTKLKERTKEDLYSPIEHCAEYGVLVV